jgi:hypothetical protein
MAVPLGSGTELRLWQSQRVSDTTTYLVVMGAQLTDRPRVRETTLWWALSEVKRVFVVVALTTVSYS